MTIRSSGPAARVRRPAIHRVVWVLLLGLSLAACAGSRDEIRLPPGMGDALDQSRAAVAGQNYQSAVTRLLEFLRENPGSALVDEANFLLGRAYLGIKDRVQAADYFQRILRDFPESRFGPDAAYHLATCYDGLARGAQLDQDWTDRALTAYGAFLVQNPDHPRVAEARERIRILDDRLARKALESADLYMRMRAWESARIYYQKVIDEHPLSRLLCEARLGLAASTIRLLRYDEAVAILEAMQPDCTTGDERKEIDALLARARNGLAERSAATPDSARAGGEAGAER